MNFIVQLNPTEGVSYNLALDAIRYSVDHVLVKNCTKRL